MNIEINLLGIFLAAVASVVIRILWYSPRYFGKWWSVFNGYPAESQRHLQKKWNLYSFSFVLALLTAYMLWGFMALAENFYHFPRVQNGLTTGFLLWLGFMMPVQLTHEIFGSKKWWLFAINTGYQLVSILVMGLVLGVV